LLIQRIKEDSPFLDQVKQLWRHNSSTLGRFPEGAFLAYAGQGNILVAVEESQRVIGYLAYRISYNKVTIVHLCTETGFRKHGIAKGLVQFLKEETKSLDGIGLKCRRDFPAYSLWPRLGFVAQYDTPGRGFNKKDLTYFWLDYGHPHLFSCFMEEINKLCIVIDANVFIDFFQEPADPYNESQGLLADWVQGILEIFLTDEIKNDINRADKQKRNQLLLFTQQFKFAHYSPDLSDQVFESLLSLYFSPINDHDRSDLYHLSKTIASGISFFVTRDERLLSINDKVNERYGVSILRPSDIIIHLDELIREDEYRPGRLSGTTVISRRLQSKEQSSLSRIFQSISEGERMSELKENLRKYAAHPDTCTLNVVSRDKEGPLALVVYIRPDQHTLEIPIIRSVSSSIAPTVIRNILLQSIFMSAKEGRYFTKVTDRYLSPVLRAAITENGFIGIAEGYIRMNPYTANKASNLIEYLSSIQSSCTKSERVVVSYYIDRINDSISTNNVPELARIEKLIWPVKILDAHIPSYIVSIGAQWAEHLFDAGLAEQNLFGVDPFLALNVESVYYRSRLNSKGISAPARILWYIKKDKSYPQTMHIRACSCLDEVIVNKPKQMYKRFNRLGVYQWNDVYNLANRNAECDIMALKFSYTELFKHPIPLKELKTKLIYYDIRSPLQSPILIPDGLFSELYLLGTGKGKGG